MSKPDPVYFLLVDDLEENLLALEALLRRDGLVLLMARSGPDALEHLLVHDVALALIDVQMPGMDGFELAELIRGTERTRRIPIIFLTAGSPDPQRRFRGYEAGAVDFIRKPIEPDVLRSKADVFFELYRQRQEVARQRDELRAATQENARLLKESLLHAEALREADRRKDEFLAMLAHELRNPLAPIRNAVRMLRLSAANAEAVQSAAAMMERQVGQMVRLVDDLLDVSRITRGKIELRRSRIDMASVVQQAVEAAQTVVQKMGHELSITLPPQPIYLNADPARLAQVVGNLLNNACKFTEKGGRISLTVECEGDQVVIRVRDTGIGIAHEQVPRIFEMFTQLDTSLERSEAGLGIGLTLVKTLVELHGGKIEAHSAGLGKGSEFVVRLPILAPPSQPSTPDSKGNKSKFATGHRILVVDDNLDAATTLAMLLKLTGNETRVAHDGVEAVEAVQSFQPDVVLLDIGLPKMNGYEACRHIREQWGQRIVLIALTGWGQEEDRRKSKEAGFDGHLVKPVEHRALMNLLSELLAKETSGTGLMEGKTQE